MKKFLQSSVFFFSLAFICSGLLSPLVAAAVDCTANGTVNWAPGCYQNGSWSAAPGGTATAYNQNPTYATDGTNSVTYHCDAGGSGNWDYILPGQTCELAKSCVANGTVNWAPGCYEVGSWSAPPGGSATAHNQNTTYSTDGSSYVTYSCNANGSGNWQSILDQSCVNAKLNFSDGMVNKSLNVGDIWPTLAWVSTNALGGTDSAGGFPPTNGSAPTYCHTTAGWGPPNPNGTVNLGDYTKNPASKVGVAIGCEFAGCYSQYIYHAWGSASFSSRATATSTLTINGCADSGALNYCNTTGAACTYPPPPPSVSMWWTPASIPYNTFSTLRWSSSGATYCAFYTNGVFAGDTNSGVFSGMFNNAGAGWTEGPYTSNQTWSMTCSNGSGSSSSSATLTVLPQTPTVTTNPATLVTSTGATVNGTANPNGSTATGWFRYSAINPGSCTDVCGTRTSAPDAALGSGSSGVNYSKAITGLSTGVTYYYCAIASNAGGKSYGSIATLIPSATTGCANNKDSAGNALTATFTSSNLSPQDRKIAPSATYKVNVSSFPVGNYCFGNSGAQTYFVPLGTYAEFSSFWAKVQAGTLSGLYVIP